MRSRTKKFLTFVFIGMTSLIAVAVVDYFQRTYFSIKDAFTALDVPLLPADAEVHARGKGGLFASWLYVIATISPEQLVAYESRLKGESSHSYSLDEEAPQARVITIESQSDDVDQLADALSKRLYKLPPSGVRPADWKIEAIRHGNVYERELPNACRYTIYTDRDKNTVFILWNHS